MISLLNSYIIFLLLFLVIIHIAFTWGKLLLNAKRAKGKHPTLNSVIHKQWPTVSIIVPAWNERDTIEMCINSLAQITYPKWEVVIVAGGSDGTFQFARDATRNYQNFRVIQQMPNGKNAALNVGLRSSNGNVLVLLDADSIISDNWLTALITPLSDDIRASNGKSFPIRSTAISQAELMERIEGYEINNSFILQGNGSIAIWRSLIVEMGGFPEDVKVGVDWDLSARLDQRGIKHTYCRQAIVFTERPANLVEYWRNEVRWRRAHIMSLFHLKEFFFRDFISIAKNIYIYGLAWSWLVLSFLTFISIISGDYILPIIWLLFSSWIFLRRAGLAIEVAVYTNDPGWLKIAWAPPLLLMITFFATYQATITLKKNTVTFKGPRTKAT